MQKSTPMGCFSALGGSARERARASSACSPHMSLCKRYSEKVCFKHKVNRLSRFTAHVAESAEYSNKKAEYFIGGSQTHAKVFPRLAHRTCRFASDIVKSALQAMFTNRSDCKETRSIISAEWEDMKSNCSRECLYLCGYAKAVDKVREMPYSEEKFPEAYAWWICCFP